jgi:ABC-type antimicrobial peptide transport system permease subunit
MIKNYLKIALRNIIRYPTYSIVNISGIAIGMACAILLLLWVQYQFSFDKFYKSADCLYRVLERHVIDGKTEQTALTTYPLATALKEEYPEIIHSTTYRNFWLNFIKGDNIVEGTLATVDKDFFEMFDIEFIKGDKKSALNGSGDIIITEDMANRYFGNEQPLGKSITVRRNYVFTVTGVIKKMPRNSQFYIDCIASSEFLKIKNGENLNDWNRASVYTFIELQKGTDSRLVREKIKGIIQRNLKESNSEILLQNIKKIHLYSQGINFEAIEYGNITAVRLAVLIVILVLSIACINFMNLLTAQSSARAKEIGVRKIAGANKRKIIFQFLGESLLIIFIAQIIAMILVELLLPAFNTVMYINLRVNYQSAGIYLILIIVVLFCGLLAGSYPALYLSSLQPVNSLKGIIITNAGKAKFRKLLVISQFTLSFLFILSTLIIKSQLRYMSSKNLGADISNIAYFDFDEGIQYQTLKNELVKNPDISGVSITARQYVLNNWSTMKDINWKGKKEGDDITFVFLQADKDYAKTFNLELKAGTYLPADEYSMDNSSVVINEKAAEMLGFKDPLGEILTTKDGLNFTITGVVKDFHFKSFHFPIDPLLIVPMGPSAKEGICFVRMNPDSVASAINYIRKTVNSYKPEYPFKIGFLETDYNNYNRIELIAGTIFGYFALLTIIISVLGLLGLSTFMTIRRTKEIGIRKAHGSKTSEIFFMLSKEYFILAGISFIIASPIAMFATNIWLQSFAYRVNLNIWLFGLAWIILMTIAMVTVGVQCYRAAHRNPVEALRYE